MRETPIILRRTSRMIAQEKLFGVLVLLVLCVNTAAAINKDIHNISYTLGETKTICVQSIDYKLCTHPAMKLSFHPPTSSSDIGKLVYNMVYRPDGDGDILVKRMSTTKYGIRNVMSRRNQSSICIIFNGLSAEANGRVFSIHQICGVTKLHLEDEYKFKFILVPPTSPPTKIKSSKNSEFLTNPSTSAKTTLKPEVVRTIHFITTASTISTRNPNPEGNKRSDDNLIGVIIGLVILVVIIIPITALFAVWIYKWFTTQRGNVDLNSDRDSAAEQKEMTPYSNFRDPDPDTVRHCLRRERSRNN